MLLSSWESYPLYAGGFKAHTGLPPFGCRLDDLTIATLIEAMTSKQSLGKLWLAEFDNNGMIKARRMPLGYAAKMQVAVGDLDRNGIPAIEGGFYYKWYRGLHCLCGIKGQH